MGVQEYRAGETPPDNGQGPYIDDTVTLADLGETPDPEPPDDDGWKTVSSA